MCRVWKVQVLTRGLSQRGSRQGECQIIKIKGVPESVLGLSVEKKKKNKESISIE